MSENIHERSLLEQADAWIRDECYGTSKLSIERLSGDQLPMDQGYIEVAIVEQPGHRTPFSRRSLARFERPYKKIPIDLSAVINAKKDAYGLMELPRKALIRGRAGVGKTTLCKKIVYDFIHNHTWGNAFDRILWVPLRLLKTIPRQECSVEGLFLHTFFSNSPNRKEFAQELKNRLDNSRSSSTLFLLDGLDEIPGGLDAGNEVYPVLDFLLRQPNVIVTSRPFAGLPGYISPVHELQITGFHPDQVKDYIEKAVADSPMAGEIQSFLQQRQLMQSLVNIPLHLDALCHIWRSEPVPEIMVPETMTRLYEVVELSFWKKDVLRLGKKDKNGNEVTARSDVQTATRSEINDLVGNEIAFLEALAFSGLHNGVIDFGPEVRDNIADRVGPSLVLDKTLPYLSLLRTPAVSSADTNYQFIHLTFQEYFAARYFARRWMSGQDVQFLDLEGHGTGQGIRFESHNITSYLGEHKYNTRYSVFWRFVSGLLQTECDEETLCLFFNTIENEPRDFLGPMHQRLIMHCLSEVAPRDAPKFKLLRDNLEDRLKQWVLFECNYKTEWKGDSRLAAEPEFPSEILVDLLQDESEHVKLKVLNSMDARPTIPTTIMEYAASHLGDNVSARMRTAAVGVFNRPCRGLPEALLRSLVSVMKCRECREGDAQSEAAEALLRQPTLPVVVWLDIVELLKLPGPSLQFRAMEILGRKSNNVPEAVIENLVTLLQFPKWRVRASAARIVSRQSVLSEAALHGIVELIRDTESFARVLGCEALTEQSTLPETVLRRLVSMLDDPEWHIQLCAMISLRRQTTLPDWAVQALVALLEDPNDQNRASAAEALGRQSTLPEAALPGLVALVGSPEFVVRCNAVKALGQHSPLPEATLQSIVALLRHTNSDVRLSAVKVLAQQTTLPQAVQKSVMAMIKRPYSVRSSSTRILGGRQSIIPEAALRGLVALGQDREKYTPSNAADAPYQYSALPEEALQGIVALLKDTNSYVRHRAMRILCSQSPLPEATVQGLVVLLRDPRSYVRSSAAMALAQEPNLPGAAVHGLMVLCHDPEGYPQCNALKALGQQPSLPEEALETIVTLLDDPAEMIRFRAAWALHQQFTGPDDERLRPFLNRMTARSFNILYKWWFTKSFWDHVAWRPSSKATNADPPDDGGNVPADHLESKIRHAREHLGIPPLLQ
ncbi:armadillo-type protein [Xylaria intraflava]|nr:armadillo-type protein [Xylaria intraflava]